MLKYYERKRWTRGWEAEVKGAVKYVRSVMERDEEGEGEGCGGGIEEGL